MHKLIEYQEGIAKILIRLIDSLLVLLEEGKPRISNEVRLESVRLMLKRRPISTGQRLLFQVLADAGDKGMTNSELAEKLGISRASLVHLWYTSCTQRSRGWGRTGEPEQA